MKRRGCVLCLPGETCVVQSTTILQRLKQCSLQLELKSRDLTFYLLENQRIENRKQMMKS